MIKSIVLLYSFVNLGDVSYGNILLEKLQQENQILEVTIIDANVSQNQLQLEYKQAKSKLHSHNSMILAIGEKGLVALATLNRLNQFEGLNAQIGACLHQYFDEIEELKYSLDFLAIPQAALDSDAKKEVVKQLPYSVLTLAIPTMTPKIYQLKMAYDNWDIDIDKKPPLHGLYIIVMLPGDAPDQHNQMKYFTKKSAQELFESIIALRKKNGNRHTIIAQNSPRTGKFSHQNEAIVCTHEYEKGQNAIIAVDDISKYFITLLEQQSIPYYFFNFAFEIEGKNKKIVSVFNQLLYVAQMKQDNYFIVPGESVTMLSQIPLYLEPTQVVVFSSDSMNELHHAIFQIIKNRGHLSYFSHAHHVLIPDICIKLKQDDATLVANGIHSVFSKGSQNRLPLLVRWGGVLALGALGEVTRRKYITPTQGMMLSIPIIFSCVYANSMKDIMRRASTSPKASL